MLNFEYLASKVPEIRMGSHNSKNGSRDPLVNDIDLIFHFFRYFPSGSTSIPNFEFLASTVPEIRGGPKILKLGHVTPS